MLSAMEGAVWQRTLFERFHPLSFVQGWPLLFCFADAPCTPSPPRRRQIGLRLDTGHAEYAAEQRMQISQARESRRSQTLKAQEIKPRQEFLPRREPAGSTRATPPWRGSERRRRKKRRGRTPK